MITADILGKAILFATNKHEGQYRKGDKRPYIMHPMSVMQRIYAIKKSSNLYLLGAAAILHDVVEDCGVTIEEIAKHFGYHVAALVSELTLDKEKYELLGKKEYLAQELVKMSSYALCIKLCDRLDNVSDMESMSQEFRERYKDETLYMMKQLHLNRPKLTKTHKALIKQILKKL